MTARNITWTVLGVLLVCIVLGCIALQAATYFRRPMFYDEFARSDRSFLWQWYRMEIVFDEAGNGVIADSVLNTVVKFEAITAAGDDSDDARHLAGSILSSSLRARSDGGAAFRSQAGVDFVVPRVKDRLVVFDSKGHRTMFPIQPGTAFEVRRRIMEGMPLDKLIDVKSRQDSDREVE